nr:ABC transporter ATP-binding protein [uncultured Cohaesibacter sp.]
MAQQIAYLPQENHCPDYITLGELVELGGYSRFSLLSGPKAHDRSVFQKALDTVGLSGMENRQVNSLSGGQRQRAWIAMVLAQDTETILLDEPVKSSGPQIPVRRARSGQHPSPRSEGKTVIAVLHDLNLTATYADDVLVLRDGRSIAAGPIADTLTGETIEEAFGLEADIFSRDRRLVCLPKRGAQNDLETGTR